MDFENQIKGNFRNNGQQFFVDVGIEAEFPEVPIKEGHIIFSNEEVFQCFEPVINRIVELVQDQILAIENQNCELQVGSLTH